MRAFVLSFVTLGGLLFVASSDSAGHGGTYRGPGDTVPPNFGGGPGTGPGGGPPQPGPVTGPGGGPQTPGNGPPGTGRPSGPGGAGGGGRGPLSGPGGKKGNRGEGFDQWQFWWAFNKDRFLNIRTRFGVEAAQSGASVFLNPRGRRVADSDRRPTVDDVEKRIIPLLESVLGESDRDIVDSSVMALGQIVERDRASLILPSLADSLKSDYASVRQASLLAFGIVGSPDAVPVLREVMRDSSEGRRHLSVQKKVPGMERAFAAIALGQIGAPETIDDLLDAISDSGSAEIDLPSCAIVALGLFEVERERIARALIERLSDRRLPRLVRAQIPVSLGRLGEPAAVPSLLSQADDDQVDIRLQESCVIALGRLAAPEDVEVTDFLRRQVREGSNVQSRHFALIAMSEIAGRAAADPESHAEMLRETERFLVKELRRPKSRAHIPWAGVSLALVAREYAVHDAARTDIIEKLVEAFHDTNNPSHKSAFAISLGLVDAGQAGDDLYEELLDTNDTQLKGYLSVALGMIRHAPARDTMRALVLDRRDAKMRLQVATALGLMGDTEALPVLYEALSDASTLTVVTSVANAIGLIGDSSAIDPLTEIVVNRKQPGISRGFAARALGLVAERGNLPWNEPMTAHVNYRTMVPALVELFDIL